MKVLWSLIPTVVSDNTIPSGKLEAPTVYYKIGNLPGSIFHLFEDIIESWFYILQVIFHD